MGKPSRGTPADKRLKANKGKGGSGGGGAKSSGSKAFGGKRANPFTKGGGRRGR